MKEIKFFTFLLMCFVFNTNYTQTVFEKYTVGPTRYGRVNDALIGFPAQGIAIGNFPNGVAPLAALHVNTNYFSTTPYGAGETFRTSSNATAGNLNAWRMFVGAGNGVEYFRIFNPAGSFASFIQNSQVDTAAILGFNTGGVRTRMLIRDGGPNTNSGRIAMGNNLIANFNPQDRLHLYETDSNIVGIRISHLGTGSLSTDGAAIRVQTDREFRFIQFENRRINFLTPTPTSPISSFRIEPDGRTYVGQNVGFQLTNRFTIDSRWDDPTNPDATKSGLRFVDLTSAETPVTNPGSGVLSVDANGNVIYVPGGEIDGAHNGASLSIITPDFVTFGQDYGQAGNPGRLLNDREVPLENNEINFSGQGTVHISQGSGVLNTNTALDVSTQASGANSSIGINFSGKTSNNLVDEKGIQAAMSLNTLAANNNSALLELSNTNKQSGAAGWLIKANGFYGTGAGADLADQASFGVLGNGNTVLNVNQTVYLYP